MRPETTLEGTVDRIVYANEENAFCVLKLVVRGRGQVTAVGSLLGVQPGESLRLTGRWHHDRKYGEQFRAESYLTVQPSTFVGIEKYLGSGLIRGIGKELARRLVQRFGLDTLEVIDRQPERLAEVEGIGPVRSRRIRQAWQEQREIRDVMVFLQSHGVSTSHAVKVWKQYGGEAVARVRENPFRLAREVWGIGFRSADQIARDLGIPADSPHRIGAGVDHVLHQATDQGHVYLPRRELVERAAELLEQPAEQVEPAVDRGLAAGELAAEPLPESGDTAVFSRSLAEAEQGVADAVRTLLSGSARAVEIDVPRAVEWFESREALTLAPQQRAALEAALTRKVLVLTGGPGTGKTTLIRGIVRVMTRKGLRVELAAPTGRAAKRMSEATGFEARTVHRLLEFDPRAGGFQRDAAKPLEADVVIVDESSMLDVQLAHRLLAAVPARARLILVGDVDQLPSVGPGRVLEDLILSQAVPVARLTEIYRQAEKSLIVVNAHRVRAGEMPRLLPEEDGDFFFVEREEPEAVLATVKLLVGKRIPGRFGFDPRDAIQVLTPMQRGLLGAANLNAELQALLNPSGEAVTSGSRLLRVGDRVMQVRNNYDREVFNGDIGRVESIDEEERLLRVDVDGRRVRYELADLDELVLAYACSIHKSQGSEYPAVVIPLHTQHYLMLNRNLLYTAITRGRRLVVVVGHPRALALAVRQQTANRRNTLLTRRLRPAAAPAAAAGQSG